MDLKTLTEFKFSCGACYDRGDKQYRKIRLDKPRKVNTGVIEVSAFCSKCGNHIFTVVKET
jgi:hypothetical protein